MGPHLTDDRLAARTLDVDERRHLDRCAECRSRATSGGSSTVTFSMSGPDVADPGETADLGVQPGSSAERAVDLHRREVALSQEVRGRYERVREIGAGGMGRVDLVEDRHLGRRIALKEHTGRAATDRFLREARITAQLEHPGIVPVYDLGIRSDGSPFYTMRRVRGRTLADALSACDGLEDRLRLVGPFASMCHTLGYAHEKGVVHRDLKPDNVMVGEHGETIVLDWGLAKAPGDAAREEAGPIDASRELRVGHANLTRAGAVMGTIPYMSPEQAVGGTQRADARSDVWSLGTILYEILTGRRAFQGNEPTELLIRVQRGAFPPAVEVCPQAPIELRAIVDRAMALDPDTRYPSAGELAQDVEAWRDGRRVSAHVYSRAEELSRLVRRYRNGIAALGLILLLSGLYLPWLIVERDRAERVSAVLRDEVLRGRAADAEHRHEVMAAVATLRAAIFARLATEEPVPPDLQADLMRLVSSHAKTVRVPITPDPERTLMAPDGRWVAVAAREGSVTVYDAVTGAPTAVLRSSRGTTLGELQSSRDGARLLARFVDRSAGTSTVAVWEVGTGQTLAEKTVGPRSSLEAASLSPDGGVFTLTETPDDGSPWNVHVLDAATGAERRVVPLGPAEDGSLRVAALCSDALLLAWRHGGPAVVWNLQDGLARELPVSGETITAARCVGPTAVAISRLDGSRRATILVYEGDLENPYSWSFDLGRSWADCDLGPAWYGDSFLYYCTRPMLAKRDDQSWDRIRVDHVCAARGATLGTDRTWSDCVQQVEGWDPRSGAPVNRRSLPFVPSLSAFDEPNRSFVAVDAVSWTATWGAVGVLEEEAATAPDGIIASSSGWVGAWNGRRRFDPTQEVPGEARLLLELGVGPDDEAVGIWADYFNDSGGGVEVWRQGADGAARLAWRSEDDATLARISSDGTTFLLAESHEMEVDRFFAGETKTGCVRVERWSDGGELTESRVCSGGEKRAVRDFDLSRDGSTVAVLWTDGTLSISSPAQETRLADRGGDQVGVSPDGAKVAVLGPDQITIHPVFGGVPQTLPGQRAAVDEAAWSPDSSTLALATRAGTIVVWDLAASASTVVAAANANFSKIGFAPDGRRLVWTAGARLQVLDLPTGELVQDVTSPSELEGWSYSEDGTRIYLLGEEVVTSLASAPSDLTEALRAAGTFTNLRMCAETMQLVAVVPFPGPEVEWAPDALCRSDP